MTTDSQDILLAALEQAPFAALLFATTDEMTLLWRNNAHALMTESAEQDVEGKPLFEAFPPSEETGGAAAVEAIHGSVSRLKAGGAAEAIGPYRFDLRGSDGTFVEHHWTMRMSPVAKGGRVEAVLQVAEDTTADVLSKRLDATLKRTASSTAAVAYFSFDPETGAFERSADVDAMFGFEPGEIGEDAAPFFERVHPDDVGGVYAEVERVFAAPQGDVASFDYRVPLPDGPERFIRIRGEVATDPKDRRNKLVGTFVDLTDMEEARKALALALDHREALVQEANHRIKNSLAIAGSMLRMQERALARGADVSVDDAVRALDKTAARIGAISDVHGLMELRGTSASVSLSALTSQLVQSMQTSADVAPDALTLGTLPRDYMLSSENAVSLGLIINELFTNALKYGTGAPSLGYAELDDCLQISVENTVSEQGAISGSASTGLGSRLMEQLASQLDGRLETEHRGGQHKARLSVPLTRFETP